MRILENKTVKEKAYFEELENGLKVIIIPKENTNKKMAIIGTKFGSIDNHFINPKTNEEEVIPDGVAHFLEQMIIQHIILKQSIILNQHLKNCLIMCFTLIIQMKM